MFYIKCNRCTFQHPHISLWLFFKVLGERQKKIFLNQFEISWSVNWKQTRPPTWLSFLDHLHLSKYKWQNFIGRATIICCVIFACEEFKPARMNISGICLSRDTLRHHYQNIKQISKPKIFCHAFEHRVNNPWSTYIILKILLPFSHLLPEQFFKQNDSPSNGCS